VSVPANSATSVSNTASAWGGGDLVHTGSGNAAGSNTDSVTVMQVPASITMNGGQTQSASIGSAFGSLAVTVKDAGGVVIPNYSSVTFTAVPAGNGASGTFSNSSGIITVPTNGMGVADPGTFTANSIAGGPYSVTAAVTGASASFSLTNTFCRNPNPNPNSNPESFAAVGDFNGDCRSDILWQNGGSGEVYESLMNGAAILNEGSPGNASSPWVIKGVGDFNGDHQADILWQNSSSGEVYLWLMNGTTIANQGEVGVVAPSSGWLIAGVGDFNDDGKADILWRNSSSGEVYLWLMDGTTIQSQGSLGSVTSDWVIQGMGDFNDDGNADIVWRNTTSGEVYLWLMNGTTIQSQGGVAESVPPSSGWAIAGVGDFNDDGTSDILWQNSTSGEVYIWFMDGTTIQSQAGVAVVSPSSGWAIQGVGDFNDDGSADILWRNSPSGEVYLWLMNGLTIASQGGVENVTSDWQISPLLYP
jgi:hypothetical protein